MFGVEEQRIQQLLGVVLVGRLTRTQAMVDLDDRFAVRLDLVDRRVERVDDTLIVAEQLQNLLIRIETERADEVGHRHLARAVDTYGDDVVRVRLQLDPGTAVRDDRSIVEMFTGRIDILPVIGTRGTYELADDDTLSTVDDERTRIRHQWEITHEDFLLFNLARLAVDETHVDPDWGRHRHIALFALVQIVLRLAQREALEGEHEITREILDW